LAAYFTSRLRRFLNVDQSSFETHGHFWTYSTSVPKAAALLSKARFTPSMAVAMRVTDTIPITMPSVVRTERILLARIARNEMINPSLSSVRKCIVFPS
jgi:hypothetical protein